MFGEKKKNQTYKTMSSSSSYSTIRLNLYVASAKKKMDENFEANPCLGLHFGFGDKEIGRLQAAIERHGRQDQFDNMSVPVDVLLRTLSFIPNPRDPRIKFNLEKKQDEQVQLQLQQKTDKDQDLPLASIEQEKKNIEDDAQHQDFIQKTMFRLASTCSTIMYCICENKCVLGSKTPPESDLRVAQQNINRHRLLEASQKQNVAKREKSLLEKRRLDKLSDERAVMERARREVRQHGIDPTARDYEGLPLRLSLDDDALSDIGSGLRPILDSQRIMADISKEVNEARCLLEALDYDLDGKKNKKNKKGAASGGGEVKKKNLWGK